MCWTELRPTCCTRLSWWTTTVSLVTFQNKSLLFSSLNVKFPPVSSCLMKTEYLCLWFRRAEGRLGPLHQEPAAGEGQTGEEPEEGRTHQRSHDRSLTCYWYTLHPYSLSPRCIPPCFLQSSSSLSTCDSSCPSESLCRPDSTGAVTRSHLSVSR